MRTKFASFMWPCRAAFNFLPICLAVFLGGILQSHGAATFKVLHSFAGGKSDGSTPIFESSLAPSGSLLYGMTKTGGTDDGGVLFQINTNGSGFKVVHDFDGISILNMNGVVDDGAYPCGTPVVSGSTLYGMTEQGGSNGYVGGVVYSVNTDGTGFQVLHHFGAYGDGLTPCGTLVLADGTLFGMTQAGGTNVEQNGVIFSVGIDGSNYKILQRLGSAGIGSPQGSLLLWGTTLYGMTSATIFRIETNGTSFLPFHQFAGAPNDGGGADGSLTRSGSELYGMTYGGGQNSVGCVFKLELLGSVFTILHSFSLSEAANPFGSLALSGSTLYGMTSWGVTNYKGSALGGGAIFQINTNGNGYQVMHTFLFPVVQPDGELPFGTPLVQGSELYGMTSLGGSLTDHEGCLFAMAITPATDSGGGGGGPLSITTPSPLPSGSLHVAYNQQLAASGGTAPYTFSVSAGHLPPGMTLNAAGVIAGKPTAGTVASFTIKVKDHTGLTSTAAFSLTIIAPDKTRPTFLVTTPLPGQNVNIAFLNAYGRANDNVAVAGVYLSLNGGAWMPVKTTDNFTNWYFQNLPMTFDANVLRVYAVDTSNNYSKTNTIKFIYGLYGSVIISTNGRGHAGPTYTGRNLLCGAFYPVAATASPGSVFVNWTDGDGKVVTNKAAFKFEMLPNLALTANFALKASPALSLPSGAMAGNYHGLVVPVDSTFQSDGSGAIDLTISQSGCFSIMLFAGGSTVEMSGVLDDSGAAQTVSSRPGRSDLTTSLQCNVAHQSISGTVTDGDFVARITANRDGFNASHPALNYQGKYKMAIPGIAPGTVIVDPSGNVNFLGSLDDGTRVSQSSALSSDGLWSLYLQPHGANHSFSAWTQFTDGTIQWLEPKGANPSRTIGSRSEDAR